MCDDNKACTKCKLSGIMAKKKSVGKKRRRVSLTKYRPSSEAMKTVKTGGEVVVGLASTEYLTDKVMEQFPNTKSENLATTRVIVKAVLTLGVGYLAFTKAGRKYKKDILTVTGGMAANTIITAVRPRLTDDQKKYLAIKGVAGMPSRDYSRNPRAGNQGAATRGSRRRVPLAS